MQIQYADRYATFQHSTSHYVPLHCVDEISFFIDLFTGLLQAFIHWLIAGTHASFAQTVLYPFELGNLRERGRSMPMGPFLGEGNKHPFADVSMFSQVL